MRTVAAVVLCAVVLSGCSPGPDNAAAPASPASPAAPDAPASPSEVAPEEPQTTSAPPDEPEPPPADAPSPRPTVIDAQPRPTPSAPPSEPGEAPQRRRYAFPVQPASAASYGREHHDYPATDIFAACGTDVVASASGVVEEVSRRDRWDPVVNDGATRGGKSVSIVGDDGVRYYGSHFLRVAGGIRPGTRVEPGTPLGQVGRTGSARETPCHLHFGISPPRGPGDWEIRRGVIYPWPFLDSWRDGGHRSPARAIRRWSNNNPG